MNKLSNTDINYLGALLHDIGKLVWRAQEIKAGMNHEILGEQFIREYLGKIKVLKDDIEQIINAANRQSGNIWISDVTTAQEREDSDDKAPRRYLEAITNRVDLGSNKKQKSENYWYYKPVKLTLEKGPNFPIDSAKKLFDYEHDEIEYVENHRECLNEFINELNYLINETDFQSFANTFYKLLEKYTTKVLSAGYLSHPDISLFDHSRITAALSVCFDEGEKNKECLLVKGDITGIQSYIYDGIREMTDIAKRLRGRSFTIQLLTEIIARYLLNKLGLYQANLIYNGGGHFLMLLPNNERNRDLLTKLSRSINSNLLQMYISKLSMVFDFVECNGNEFVNNFREVYLQLDKKLNENKKLKFRYSLNEIFKSTKTAKELRKDEEGKERDEKLVGERLPKLKYLIISNEDFELKNTSTLFTVRFQFFDSYVYLCNDYLAVEQVISNKKSNSIISIISVNDTDFLEPFKSDVFLNVSKEFRLIGNYVPTNEKGIIYSFEDLAKKYSSNYPLLGIMRLDVDNLGAVFSFGMLEKNDYEKKYTPSRIANLSRELNWFFTGYINNLAKDHNIYIAYSGGDDVFVVGNWCEIIKFARKLRKDFNEFVCNNQNLSASAGIIFTKPNFPISQSAQLAGQQEHLAKATVDKIEKNKVGVLDIQLSWKEFSEFIIYAFKLIKFIEKDDGKKIIPRSLLHYIYSLTKDVFDRQGRLNLKKFTKATTHLTYSLARRKVTAKIIETKNKEKKINRILYELAVKLLLSDDKQQMFKKIKFPLTLVLYKTRR